MADGIVPVPRLASSHLKKSQCFSSNLKAIKDMYPKSNSQAGEISYNLWRVSFFILFRPSTDWMRPTHIEEDNLFYLICQIQY